MHCHSHSYIYSAGGLYVAFSGDNVYRALQDLETNKAYGYSTLYGACGSVSPCSALLIEVKYILYLTTVFDTKLQLQQGTLQPTTRSGGINRALNGNIVKKVENLSGHY